MVFFSASINQCDSARSVSKALEYRMTSSLFLWTMETVAEIIHNFSHQNLPCESFIFRSQLNFLWTLTLPFKKTMVPLVSVSFWTSLHWKWTVTRKALFKYCPSQLRALEQSHAFPGKSDPLKNPFGMITFLLIVIIMLQFSKHRSKMLCRINWNATDWKSKIKKKIKHS